MPRAAPTRWRAMLFRAMAADAVSAFRCCGVCDTIYARTCRDICGAPVMLMMTPRVTQQRVCFHVRVRAALLIYAS